MNRTPTTELISEVRAVCRHIAHAPRRSDLLEHTDHSEQIFKRRFGSLKNVLEAADIPTYNLGKMARSRLSSTISSASQFTSTGRHIVPTSKPTVNTTSRHTLSGAKTPGTTS
jgi:S-adenosylmethionine:tRNA-ribosyltransferase-isomerase (queuine synthetase)